MRMVFQLHFTDDEKIDYLKSNGWDIEKSEKTVWVQTGPYDRVGEYETEIKYYASKVDHSREEMDYVFRRLIEERMKEVLIPPVVM